MKRNTKEIIWQEALQLFCKRGYDGVSIKDIANAVGIKDSSLYKHYKSKQQIFDTIIEEVNTRITLTTKNLSIPKGKNIADAYEHISTDTLEQLCYGLFDFYLNDPIVSKYRKMLTIEQYANSDVAKIYQDTFINGALDHETRLFRELIDRDLFVDIDPYIIALHFYSPLFLLFSKFDYQPIEEKKLRELIKRHVSAFSMNYVKQLRGTL